MSRVTAFRDAESRGLSFAGEPEESKMKNKLLATVAVAAVVGFGGFAAAQGQMGGENRGTSGATPGATSGAASGPTQQKSGGMSGTQSGNKTLSPSSTQSSNPSQNQSAQDKSGKDNERLGQGRNDNESTRGAQRENSEMQQKGAQQGPGLQKNQRGAQDQRGNNLQGAQQERGQPGNLKGAQEQRGTNMRGAQEQQRGATIERNATEQNGRTGVNVGERGKRGGSAQLSEDQRSQIKTIIGRERGPRLGSANFDVRVGTRIPRSVHYAVLPPDIVRIVPQYRGFNYFLVQDEIIIVDPRTLEIVAIIPA
jgi:Protein of unknown function (DUF1236)